MIDYYAKRARHYESIHARPERQEDLRRLRELVVGQFRGRRVLESACGTGYWTELLAAFWWSHVPRPRLREFLREFHRVLARGATVVFLDNLHVAGNSTPISRTDDEANTYQQRALPDRGGIHHADSGRHTDGEPGMT